MLYIERGEGRGGKTRGVSGDVNSDHVRISVVGVVVAVVVVVCVLGRGRGG